MIPLTDAEKAVLKEIQGDFPLTASPFAEIAGRVHLTEEEVLKIMKNFLARGIVRRIGAILYHRRAGMKANAMGVWKVPEGDVNRIGMMMAENPRVTHCYHRDPVKNWPYNLYTMIHGKTEEDCGRIAERLSRETGIRDYRLLFSSREFKKESLKIFE
jgi:DNA-binding Lrp family transcriptional regulator